MVSDAAMCQAAGLGEERFSGEKCPRQQLQKSRGWLKGFENINVEYLILGCCSFYEA